MTSEELLEDIRDSRIIFINREFKVPKKICVNSITAKKLLDKSKDIKVIGMDVIIDDSLKNDKFRLEK